MPTQKIDPKVIFASDAPAIDKPPVFGDKTKGWDVSRANDGRPTIKEMNKVQQDTDLKILWLNENSVTPYDESIDYPDGAVAIKDGSFKQLVSGAWVEFLDDFADKTEVNAALLTKTDKTYVDGQLALKADKSEVDKFYPTLAQANADIANIAVNQPVNISESQNFGVWYKATAGATSLTKSPYDPLTQASADATTKANAAEANAKTYADETKIAYKKAVLPDVLVTVTDANGNHTWLQANNEDGGLTATAEEAVREKIGMQFKSGGLPMFAVVDEAGNMTDLQLDSAGQIPDAVIAEWAKRLNLDGGYVPPTNPDKYYSGFAKPVISTSQSSVKAADTYYKNGELLPMMPDINKVIIIGSSSASRFSGSLTSKLKVINPDVEVYDASFGGAVVEQQNALVGNVPLRLRFENDRILASGASNVTELVTYAIVSKVSTMTGYVNGVLGSLSVAGSSIYFTRTNAAATDTLLDGDVDFIPSLGSEYRNAAQVIWIGKNNLTSSVASINSVTTLMDNTDSIIEYAASFVKRSIVMTHFVNGDTPAISSVRDRINQCNALYKLRYKQNVFDVEPILLGTQIFTDLGITRTAEDIEQQELGNLAPSLSSNTSHCSTTVYNYLAQKLADFIAAKNLLGA